MNALPNHTQTFHLNAPDEIRAQAPDFYDALQLIRKSPLGQRLLVAAEKHEVSLIKENLPGNRGSCLNKTIKSSWQNTMYEDAGCVIPHELIHWVQPEIKTAGWSFRSRLLYLLCKEAGAQTGAIRVCYEMKLNGCNTPFDHLSNPETAGYFRPYASLYRLFDRAYTASLDQKKTEAEALIYAGNLVFNAHLQIPELIYKYGVLVLKHYTEDALQENDHPIDAYDLESAKKQARLNDDDYLIHKVEIPHDEILFSGNNLLRQAFQYVEAARIAKYFKSKTTLGAQTKIHAMEADENPFFQIDLRNVFHACENQENEREPHDFLFFMAEAARKKKLDGPQLALDFAI